MNYQTHSIYDLFAQRAAVQSEDPAFISTDEIVLYGEFIQQVDSLSAGLHLKGIKKGDRVATVAKNSINHFAVLLACTRLGAIVFPVNWRLASSELDQTLELTEPAAIFIDPEFSSSFSQGNSDRIQIKGQFGEDHLFGFLNLEEFFSDSKLPENSIQRDDPAVIIATAAVAGVPRGAVLTHGNLLSVSRMFANAYQLSKTDRYLGVLPLFHIAGIEYLFVMAEAGGASVILPRFDAELGNQMIDEHQVSLITTFPPMLEKLMDAREESGAHWESLRVCWGILNPPEIVQRYLDMNCGEYWTGYGQTETTGIATLGTLQERPGSAGRVVDGLEMRIVAEDDQETSTGQPGEIIIRGNLVFSHYWRDEDASSFARRGGWHHTGDLGKVDEDGYLYYEGRKPEKELIKSGGENIYPAEVENAIRQLPEVTDVCVIGVPDEKWGETVKAVVELASGYNLDEDQLLSAVSDHLASYKKPRIIEFVDQLPRNKDGNIDRIKVKADFG